MEMRRLAAWNGFGRTEASGDEGVTTVELELLNDGLLDGKAATKACALVVRNSEVRVEVTTGWLTVRCAVAVGFS